MLTRLLGDRILQEYPALHQFDDPVPNLVEELLRKPFPAQTIAIMGVAKRWQQARTAMVVAVDTQPDPASLVEGAMDTASIVVFGQRPGSLARKRRAKPVVPEQASLFSLS